MKKKILYFLSFSLAFSYFIYLFCPYFLDKYYTEKSYKDYSLEVKKLYFENDFFEYVQGGVGKTIVFVHGFQNSKFFWLPYLKKLAKKYKVIALDLPGHGNSSRPKDQKYDLQSLSKTLDIFIQKKKLKDFYLVGISMGGGIASCYAYDNPQKVKSLILINPLGILCEKKSEVQQAMLKGKNPFFPKTLNEFDELVSYTRGKPMALSIYLKKYILNQMVKNYSFLKKVLFELIETSIPLNNVLSKITTPTLIFSSQKDRVIHPETYEFFIQLMPNIKPIRFKEAGHVLADQYFEESVKEIDNFLKSH